MPPGPHAAIHRAIARFAAERGGNVAAIFAIACIPVIAAMGVAVDYTRGSQAASTMQDALDAATLALSRRSDLSALTEPQIQQIAQDYFDANFHNTEIKDLTLQASYTASGPSISINAAGNLPTDFMGLLGKEYMPIGRTSTTVWGEARLRVALALDNTGSMASSNKLTALKTATHNLLDQLKDAAKVDGDVYVSIIPFVKDVNVGSANYDQSWVKWDGSATKDADLWDKLNGTCSGGAYASYYHNQAACAYYGYTWTPLTHSSSNWNGCVTDRDQSYDTLNTAPTTSDTATLYPAEQYAYCPVSLMGLSYDWTGLNSKVDTMAASGSTNQAIGLQWAWQSLTSAPFTIPATDAGYIYKQVIILLSDGLNTQDRWYGNGYSTSTQVDARQKILCDNIKAAGVILYTVQVNTTGDPTSTLLQGCASSSDKFFLLTSADQIVTTFQQIGTQLSELRISK